MQSSLQFLKSQNEEHQKFEQQITQEEKDAIRNLQYPKKIPVKKTDGKLLGHKNISTPLGNKSYTADKYVPKMIYTNSTPITDKDILKANKALCIHVFNTVADSQPSYKYYHILYQNGDEFKGAMLPNITAPKELLKAQGTYCPSHTKDIYQGIFINGNNIFEGTIHFSDGQVFTGIQTETINTEEIGGAKVVRGVGARYEGEFVEEGIAYRGTFVTANTHTTELINDKAQITSRINLNEPAVQAAPQLAIGNIPPSQSSFLENALQNIASEAEMQLNIDDIFANPHDAPMEYNSPRSDRFNPTNSPRSDRFNPTNGHYSR